MLTEKSFWLPKLPSIYGFFLVPSHFLSSLYPQDGWNYWRISVLFTIPYILMSVGLVVYLCRFSNRGAEPICFASVHWGIIFLSSLLICFAGAGEGGLHGLITFVYYLFSMPLFPFSALFPSAFPIGQCVFSGLLTFPLVRCLYHKKHS